MTEGYVLIATAILSFSVIGLLVFTNNRHLDWPAPTKDEQKRAIYMFTDVQNRTDTMLHVCHTQDCIQVAEYLKSSIDSSVNPCDDFYTYCCGGWIRHNPIPKSYNDYSTFTKLSQVIETELRDLLERTNSSDGNLNDEALVKTKQFYKSCMAEQEIEKLGPKPMWDFIREIGSWSICDDGSWKKSDWDVHKVLQHLQSTYYPASPFFSVEVTNDHLNSTKHLIKVR